jgi:hypothetical protein
MLILGAAVYITQTSKGDDRSPCHPSSTRADNGQKSSVTASDPDLPTDDRSAQPAPHVVVIAGCSRQA